MMQKAKFIEEIDELVKGLAKEVEDEKSPYFEIAVRLSKIRANVNDNTEKSYGK